MKRFIVLFNFILFSCQAALIASVPKQHTILPLWKDAVPMSLGIEEKDNPTLTIFPAAGENATDCGIIVCPGGGYAHLAMDHEGVRIAEWFNSIGVSAFVLKYRLPSNGYRHPVPLMDAQQAIRIVRQKSAKWNIDPDKIGIIGFSAGGHLASSAGTHFQKPVTVPGISEGMDTVSCRPDFMVLIYPVISMQKAITHKGSRNNLLGDDPDRALLELMSNEKQVTSETPPTFLVHADDDKAVRAENSIRFYEALHQAEVPAEMHIFLKGGHGFGMRPEAGPATEWPVLCRKWLRQAGFITK